MESLRSLVTSLNNALPVSPMALYIMLLVGVALTIASILIPYYSSGTTSYGVWTDTNKCLGQPANSDECNTMEALPIVTIILGLIAVILLGVNHGESNNFLDKIGELELSASNALGPILSLFNSQISGYHATIAFIVLTTLFSIATLITQLYVPVKPSSDSLDVQNNKKTITYKEGMSLSIAATAVFATSFLMMMTHVEEYVKAS
jgi:hypothetical protein